jgi:hypothetical protein
LGNASVFGWFPPKFFKVIAGLLSKLNSSCSINMPTSEFVGSKFFDSSTNLLRISSARRFPERVNARNIFTKLSNWKAMIDSIPHINVSTSSIYTITDNTS